jgi:high-affinity nickel-transport protein
MNELPTHWLSIIAVVFLLGLKHGLDPDHLAAIDGLTRFNAQRRPRLSRWSGLLFSAGHGVVVTLVAIAVATVATQWHAPQWLEHAARGSPSRSSRCWASRISRRSCARRAVKW